jgi:Helix-turn-helix domain
MGRHPNPRLVKIHRSYTVEEVARNLGKHKNTVRAWFKQGLRPIDGRRPTLIHGLELARFLQKRRMNGKRPCPPGHMYCFKCRLPKQPAAGMVDCLPISDTSGNLRALCPDCGRFMHRRASFAKLSDVGAGLDIVFPQAVSRLRESALSPP